MNLKEIKATKAFKCNDCDVEFPEGHTAFVYDRANVGWPVFYWCPECYAISNLPPSPPIEERILAKLDEILAAIKEANVQAACYICKFWFDGECRLVDKEYKQTMPWDACKACELRTATEDTPAT